MKRMIRSSIDLSTNARYQQIFADVFDVVKDRIIGSCLSATSMQQLVSGYNAEDFLKTKLKLILQIA